MGSKACQLFLFRHRGAALHTGDDDGLAHGGQGVLGVQRRCRAAEAGNTGGIIVADALGVQHIHLLPDGTVQAGVAGVQAHGGAACGFHLPHYCQHLFQRHFGAVVNRTVLSGKAQQSRVDQTARIDDAVGCLQKGRAAPGDQVRSTGACAYKMYHNITPLPERW